MVTTMSPSLHLITHLNANRPQWRLTETQRIQMHIDMWADLTCPWCYLHLRHLRKALTTFPAVNEVTVSLHAYFLDPELDTVWEKSHALYRNHIHDEDIPDVLAQYDRLTTLGKAEGIRFEFDRLVVAPTTLAWQAVNYAREEDFYQDKATGPDTYALKLAEAIGRAHFEMALNIANPEVIIGCAQDIGLNPADLHNALHDSTYTDQAVSEYHMALNYGIDAVPILIIDQQYVVQGLQPLAAVTNILHTAWDTRTGKAL